MSAATRIGLTAQLILGDADYLQRHFGGGTDRDIVVLHYASSAGAADLAGCPRAPRASAAFKREYQYLSLSNSVSSGIASSA